MKKVFSTKPIRYCQYRFCPEPKEIPAERRSDALYCCDEHGYSERNERNNDNIIVNGDLRKLRECRNTLNFLFSHGKSKGLKNVLDALGFHFDVLTEYKYFNEKTNALCYRIFDFELEVTKDNYTIKKID